MLGHLGPRMHAFWHGLFQTSDKIETRELYDRLVRNLRQYDLYRDEGRDEWISDLTAQVIQALDINPPLQQLVPIVNLVQRTLDFEEYLVLPHIDWTHERTVTEYWELRDHINAQLKLLEDFEQTQHLLLGAFIAMLRPIFKAVPAMDEEVENGDSICIPVELVYAARDVGNLAEQMTNVVFADEVSDAELFERTRYYLDRNVIAASGGNPDNPNSFNRRPVLPSKSDIKDPHQLIDTYLGSTPLRDFWQQQVEFTILTKTRFEHHHIVAGSGHGKTQTLQYLIGKDLEAVAASERSVVVLDSQGDLIRNISQLAEFAPGGRLHDRVVIIDPTDVEYPVSLNLFDVGMDRLQGYAPLERERLTNSILELYDFVLGSLLAAEMTQKQSVIFRYVTRLMLHIPDATIHTLRDLMEPNSHVKFAEHIQKLSGSAKHFFETEFASKEFEQTKKQVLRRLWGILENQTFERMFSHPRSKLDLFAELNAGKIILINTAKDLLKEQGTQIFGRFFIALIAQAAQERATLPENERKPTFVYIDEAADYFDRNIAIILSQARKYKVGMILAHQYLGQLDPKLQEAFAANTSIKFAGGVSAKDARTLAPMLYCEPSLIEQQFKGSFAAYVRGSTKSALPLEFPFGFLEQKKKQTKGQLNALQNIMRERYAEHYSELGGEDGSDDQKVHATKANEEADETSDAAPTKDQDKPSDDPSTDATPNW